VDDLVVVFFLFFVFAPPTRRPAVGVFFARPAFAVFAFFAGAFFLDVLDAAAVFLRETLFFFFERAPEPLLRFFFETFFFDVLLAVMTLSGAVRPVSWAGGSIPGAAGGALI
jgi:hypothetical protein